MIINVRKHLFIGAREDLDHFFFRAQQKGFIEFIQPPSKKRLEFPEEIDQLMAAMKILKKLPVLKPYNGEWDPLFAGSVATDILELKAEVEKYAEEIRLLETEIARVSPFGDFSMEDIDYIEKESGRKIRFFCMKSSLSSKVELPEELIYIGTSYDLDYYITIEPGHHHYPEMIEMRIDRSVGELKRQLLDVSAVFHDKEAKLKEFAIYIEMLHEAFIYHLNHHSLDVAKKQVEHPVGRSLFSIEAWIPEGKAPAIFSLLEGMAVHCEEIAVEQTDKVPTCMENKGVARIGEDLVKIYDTPATTDKDPSLWVLSAFALFFAMIVADAGYGLLYLLLAIYLKYKFPKLKGSGKRMLQLFGILAGSCIAWGVLTSSYFGLKIDFGSPLSKISLLHTLAVKKAEYHVQEKDDVYQYWVGEFPRIAQAKSGEEVLQAGVIRKEGHVKYEVLSEYTDNLLLEFSLLIGVIHISCSFLRYLRHRWAGIGWVIFMIGGYLYFPSMLHATSLVNFLGIVGKQMATEVGIQLLYGGIAIAIVLAFIQKRFKGLGEIAHIIPVFADVLSYLRLYALALASTIMAETFNEQGTAIGLALGVLVIFLGHGVNILLGVMGGVIHGLRLNFIEWFHHSFEGGGRLFKPLKKLKI